MIKRLTILVILLIGLFSVKAEITTPIFDDESSDPPVNPDDERHRSRPMIQWCTIDTEARTVTTTLTLPVITYYIIDDDEAVIVASDSPEEFAGGVAALPTGAYTLRLVTAESAYTGPLTIQ